MNCNYNIKTKFLFAILFVFSFLSILWMLSINNSFTFDDFSTLVNARYITFEELFHIFPTQTYNDRPIGLIFVKVLNILFGLNYQNYHIAFALLHFINIFLVYKISFFIFNVTEDDNNIYYPILTAAIFGIYPISIMAVSWISAVYDLLCCTFTLFCIYFYLLARNNQKKEVFYATFSVIFYYLAIRTKEMALTLPVILLIYEFYIALSKKRKIKIKWYLVINIFLMFLFVYLLFKGGIEEIQPDNPYYQSFNILNLLRNVIKYMFLYFNWGSDGFAFDGYSIYSAAGVTFFIFIIIFSIYILVKDKDFSLLLSIICIGVSLAVVLTMVNMQHRLYLYIPSIFVGITISMFIYKLFSLINFKYMWEAILIIIPCIYLINYTPGMVGYKTNWLNYCNEDMMGLEQLKKLDKPLEDTTIYVKGAKDEYNIFYYGPGNSIKLMFDDSTINTILVDEFPEKAEKPYIFLEYNDKNISEIKKDMTNKSLEILSVYPEKIDSTTVLNEDGSLNIAIVSNIINDNLKIIVNGNELETSIGKEFISAVLPKEVLKSDYIEVSVRDTVKSVKSQEMLISINGGRK